MPPRRARKAGGRRTRSADARKLRRILYFGSTSLFVLALIGSGCAGRRPVAGRQPAPTQPSNTPAGTAESAKRSTDVPERPSSPPTPRREKPMPVPAPAGYTEEGNASWYGEPFNGRRASNGEIYDMYKLTAAHRTLPFDTMVRVTNLNNGKNTTVRITDRGPFVENRIIDLSLAAAREIDLVGPGVAPVRVEVLGNVDPTVGFFTVQVGAFKDRGNAERLRDRLNASYSPIFIQQYDAPDGMFYRVRVGKISGEDAAQQFSGQLRSREGFMPFVVRLDPEAPAGGIR
ncbi:MAG TPA: septal ring lytic transglycosylase RlpA family protein [Candidatus Acidoferrum sp.]